ncbi:MAG: lipid A export permease/ATP-binding protein MsbA [Lysobacterales bacterium]
MPARGASNTINTKDSTWTVYKRLLGYTRSYLPLLGIAAVAMALDAACTGGFAALTRPLLDEALLGRDETLTARMPLFIMLIFLGRGMGSLISDYCMAAIGRSVIRDLRQQVFDTYLSLPTSYFDQHNQGQMISRLTFNVEQLAEATTSALTVVVRDTLYVVAFLMVMLSQSVKLTFFTLLIAPLIAIVIAFVSRRFRRLSRKIQDTMGDVTQRTTEVVSGHKVVKMHAGQDTESRRFGRVNSNNRRQHLKLVATKSGSTSVVQLLAGFTLAAIVYLATQDSMIDTITPGAFTAFMTAMLAILPSLKKLTNVHVLIQRGVAAAESVFELLDEPQEALETGKKIDDLQGRIAFDEVTLSYNGGEPVLTSVSFVAEPGTVTALVGKSGSGKTSLVSLIPRFYEFSSGSVTLDGDDIQDFALRSLRQNIAMVSQDIVLFDDTIAANIAYANPALNGTPDAQLLKDIEAAATQAHAMEFIEKLPQGMATRLGEGGVQLSGGQRQRLAIARAILKDAPILILDEATSALDTESERLIQAALEKIMQSRTTLVIAHRLSTVENADQVLVLDGGHIVERGSHADLLSQGGVYTELHRLQFVDGRRT